MEHGGSSGTGDDAPPFSPLLTRRLRSSVVVDAAPLVADCVLARGVAVAGPTPGVWLLDAAASAAADGGTTTTSLMPSSFCRRATNAKARSESRRKWLLTSFSRHAAAMSSSGWCTMDRHGMTAWCAGGASPSTPGHSGGAAQRQRTQQQSAPQVARVVGAKGHCSPFLVPSAARLSGAVTGCVRTRHARC